MEDMKDKTSQRLKKLMEDNRLSQAEFGKKCELSKDIVSKLLNSKISLSLTVAQKISKQFNVSLDYLFGLTDFENATQLAIYLIEKHLTFGVDVYRLKNKHKLSTLAISPLFDEYRNEIYQVHGMSTENAESALAKEKEKLLVSIFDNVADMKKRKYALVAFEYLNDELAAKLDDELRWCKPEQDESE